MPNWCDNSLEVTGPDRVLEAWVTKLRSNAGSDVGLFGTFVSPDYNEDGSNWYDAHCVAWSTKWDVEINKLDWDAYLDGVKLRFDTAWSPPMGWLESMSREWPSLQFALAFEESGMCFMGYAVFKNGEYSLAEDETAEWLYSDDQVKQIELNEAYYEAMNERREKLMHEASDAYEKGMFE